MNFALNAVLKEALKAEKRFVNYTGKEQSKKQLHCNK